MEDSRELMLEYLPSGEIVAHGVVQKETEQLQRPLRDSAKLLFIDDPEHFAVTGATHMVAGDDAIALRPESPAWIAVEGRTVTLHDLPAGSMVSVILPGLEPVTVPEGEAEIKFTDPGPVEIRIAAPWPYEAVHAFDVE